MDAEHPPVPVEGAPDSLTVRIERALLARHPVTLPPERARNYAELATSVVAAELLELRTAIDLQHKDFCAIDRIIQHALDHPPVCIDGNHVRELRKIVRPR